MRPGIIERLRTFTESNQSACEFHWERWSGQRTSREILNSQIWFTPNEFNTQTIGGRDVAVRWTAETLRSTRKFRFFLLFFLLVTQIGFRLLVRVLFSILITAPSSSSSAIFIVSFHAFLFYFFFLSISSPSKDRSNRCGYRWNLRHGHRWHSSVAFKGKFFFSCSMHFTHSQCTRHCHNLWGNSMSFQWAPIVHKINKNHTQWSFMY